VEAKRLTLREAAGRFIGELLNSLGCWLQCLFLGRQRPMYEPDRWNDPYMAGYDYGYQWENNCYNYACDIATDTFAQPGRAATGVHNTIMFCPEVSAGAIADGLRPRPAATPARGCSHTVALVVDADYHYGDYHWYRLDANGMWSHKIGSTEATNLDNSLQPIVNPETADRGRYTEFCGYFTVRRCAVEIR
jgi:hypothetical protein